MTSAVDAPTLEQGRGQRGVHLLAEREELPRLLLWVARFKVGKQLGVSQVPQARAGVSHDVGGARDVVVLG